MVYVWSTPYKGAQKLMLLAIADRCDDEGTCYPGVTSLAAKCSVKQRAAQALITELERNGELTVQVGTGIETGHGKTNRYFMKRYRETLGLKTSVHGTRIQQITPIEQGVQDPASLPYGMQKPASQAMQNFASQGVQDPAFNTSGDSSVDTSEKEETTFVLATRRTSAGPILSPNEADVSYPFVEAHLASSSVQGPEISTPVESSTQRTAADKDGTTPPPPTPSPAPRKQSALQERDAALVRALGKAWGIPASKSDYGLYVKKARKMAESMPIEKFKAFCDYRKREAGDFADKITIQTLPENGWISKFLAWDATESEKIRLAMIEAEAFWEKNPRLRPRGQLPPEQRAPAHLLAPFQNFNLFADSTKDDS